MLEAEEGGAKESDVSSDELSSLEDEGGMNGVPISVPLSPRGGVSTHDVREGGCGLGGDGQCSEAAGAGGCGPENDGQCSEATETGGRGLDADVAEVTADIELKTLLGSDASKEQCSGSELESDEDLPMPNL